MRRFGKKILALFMALMCIATIGVVSASAAIYRGPNYDAERRTVMKDSFRVSQNSPNRRTYGKYLDKNYLNTHHSVSSYDVNSWH